MPSAPEGAEWAAPAKVYDRLVYRANGAGYLPVGFDHVFVVSAEGGTPRQVSSGNFAHNTTPRFTPDGKALIVAANRRADWDMEPLDTELWEFPLAGGEAKALTARLGPDNDPAISPDGKTVAYIGFDDRYQGYQVNQLWIASRDGGAPRSLTASFDRDAEDPAWAPDGKSVLFRYDDHGRSYLGQVTLDGKITKVAEDLGATMGSYSGGGLFTVGKEGGVAYATGDVDRPGDIAYLAAKPAARRGERIAGPAPKPRLLTDVNADLFSQRSLATVERLETKSKHDGRPIEASAGQTSGLRPSSKIPADPRDPRRPLRRLWPPFRHRKADLVVPRLPDRLRQPARLHQLRPGVRQPDPPRLPGRRLLRPRLRGRRGGRQRHRRRSRALRHRRQRRRRPHLLDHRPHHPLPRRRHGLPGDQLVQLGADLRPPAYGVKYWFPGLPGKTPTTT